MECSFVKFAQLTMDPCKNEFTSKVGFERRKWVTVVVVLAAVAVSVEIVLLLF